MGKVEKIVVLSVMFLIVVILGVSQGSWGSDEVGAQERGGDDVAGLDPANRREDPNSTPLDVERAADRGVADLPPADGGRARAAAERRAAEARAAERRAEEQSAGLLSTVVRKDPQPAREPDPEPEPVSVLPALDPSWDLVTLTGLQNTYDPEYKVYTCGRSESFESIAESLYGDEGLARLLRHANEGVEDLERGQRVLVPVRDDRLAGVKTHTVQDGESLWVIAKLHYGAGHRWNEIYQANRDVLKSPDSVREGVVLRIP